MTIKEAVNDIRNSKVNYAMDNFLGAANAILNAIRSGEYVLCKKDKIVGEMEDYMDDVDTIDEKHMIIDCIGIFTSNCV